MVKVGVRDSIRARVRVWIRLMFAGLGYRITARVRLD